MSNQDHKDAENERLNNLDILEASEQRQVEFEKAGRTYPPNPVTLLDGHTVVSLNDDSSQIVLDSLGMPVKYIRGDLEFNVILIPKDEDEDNQLKE